MMLMTFEINPILNAQYLIENTNKSFVFKSLLELGQLVNMATECNIYKPIPQGQELVGWIKKHPHWTYSYFRVLFRYCLDNCKLKEDTINNFTNIGESLINKCNKTPVLAVKSAYFRYISGYVSKYKTKTELPIKHCCEEYKKYIKWKMNK